MIKQIALRLPLNIAEKLKKIAKNMNIPLHSLIVVVLTDFVKKYEN